MPSEETGQPQKPVDEQTAGFLLHTVHVFRRIQKTGPQKPHHETRSLITPKAGPRQRLSNARWKAQQLQPVSGATGDTLFKAETIMGGRWIYSQALLKKTLSGEHPHGFIVATSRDPYVCHLD
jgi:hypothetical protein